LRHVRHQLCRIGETRVGQNTRAADGPGDGCNLVGRNEKNEPFVVLGAVDGHRCIRGVHAIVQPEEFRIAQRGLDRDAAVGQMVIRHDGLAAGSVDIHGVNAAGVQLKNKEARDSCPRNSVL
jgi:hypothetical protein